MLKKRLGAEGIEKVWNEDRISYYYKIPTSLIIPEDCERIGDCAFLDCWRLKKVSIPGSVKKINYGAFWGCNDLREVIIPEGVVKIGHYAFYQCEGLKEVLISESVERIEDWAFGGCPVANIILHKPWSKFEFIATNAFLGCKDVKVNDATVRGFRLLEELLRGIC